MFLVFVFVCTLFFLFGSFFLTALISAFRRLQKKDIHKQTETLGRLFFYRPLHQFFLPKMEYEGIFLAAICAQNLTRFGYAACGVIFLSQTGLSNAIFNEPETYLNMFWMLFSIFVLLLGSLVLGDYLPRIFGTLFPEKILQISLPIASLFLILAFPLAYVLLKISHFFSKDFYFDPIQEPSTQAKQEIIELIQEAEVSPILDSHDKKLIESVLTFKERSVREIMVPRVDVFTLSADLSIKETARLLEKEGYSRTPVYRNTVDNIVGILMYKDILRKYMEFEEKGDPKILEAPIETILKNILYTPETKKISSLLQEFRKKQVHVAIVVDEYGGTEGIVTIEDILEEIVGEISDEYDEEEETLKHQPDGSWIVDAKMNLFDVEEKIGIEIPQEEGYDTLGGYLFHVAGAIPLPGFIVHHDDFELEVIESSDRSVEKVRIKQIKK